MENDPLFNRIAKFIDNPELIDIKIPSVEEYFAETIIKDKGVTFHGGKSLTFDTSESLKKYRPFLRAVNAMNFYHHERENES